MPNPASTAQMPFRLLVLFCLALCVSCRNPSPMASAAGVGTPVLTMMPSGENTAELAFLMGELRQYRVRTGVEIKTLATSDSMDARLRLFQNLFAKRSPEPDIGEIDDIWPGLLADDLIDLRPYLGDETTAIDKGLLDAFTVKGRLVALPQSVETGVLYYRTDLLKKYGYRGPPETWDERVKAGQASATAVEETI